MYEISVHRVFVASHAIRLYDGSLEPMHSHDWPVEVTVAAGQLDSIETVMDFHVLQRLLDAVLAPAQQGCLNELEPFVDTTASGDAPPGGRLKVNPTAERVAWWIGTEMAKNLSPRVRLVSVRVGETPGCFATYRP